MKCKVNKSKISGELTCPPNKSYTHRAIFLASLALGNSTVKNALLSADTCATINACKSLGARLDVSGDIITVKKPISFEQSCTIHAENSGTTVRIAAAIAALSETKITLAGDESLQKRPMQPILTALEMLGATCTSSDGCLPITVQGKIRGGSVIVQGNISSQFITSLLICAPLTVQGITVNIGDQLVSKPYLDATIASMMQFGVTVQTNKKYKQYTVKPQQYKETAFIVPPDYSSMALLLSAAVLVGKDVSIRAAHNNLPQGDKAFLEILENLGVRVDIDGDLISIYSPDVLGGGTFDLSDTPDLLPPLSILVLKCQSMLEIVNVKHARYKETDRIAIVSRELSKLGIKIDERDDGMQLQNTQNLHGANLDSEKDHRLFMAFCIAAMYVGNCTVTDPESVSVSYPDFISDMNKIGADILL